MATAVYPARKGETIIPVRFSSGEELALSTDITAMATDKTAAAKSTQSPCCFRKFFNPITYMKVKDKEETSYSRETPNRSSIRARRSTGRPMTLKKSPSSRSTSRAPRPWTP